MLKSLHLRNVGPAKEFALEFGKRLNVLTGDNGLGKSLLLDVAWWACTHDWPSSPALPDQNYDDSHLRLGENHESEIISEISDEIGANRITHYQFVSTIADWTAYSGRPTSPPFYDADAVKIYARLDGGFCISDPYREVRLSDLGRVHNLGGHGGNLQLTKSELWDGKRIIDRKNDRIINQCNGLLADWLSWEIRDQKYFNIFFNVLKKLSPPGEIIHPAAFPIRLPGRDVSDVPAIKLQYGVVPVTHASAGIQRVLGLAYAIAWAIRERNIIASLRGDTLPEKLSVLLIVDEIEAHLHPRWQRALLPALLSVSEELGEDTDIQFIVSTHSPLVLASLETEFSDDSDRLFHLKLEEGEVTLSQEEWYRRGDVSRWLTSDIFDLGEARSLEAEKAIAEATDILRAGVTSAANVDRIRAADDALRQTLPSMDPVWARWVAFKSRLMDTGVAI